MIKEATLGRCDGDEMMKISIPTLTALVLAITPTAYAELIVPDDVAQNSTRPTPNSHANPNALQPPYKAGQVVVKGTPEDYAGYDIIKVLPNAGLLVLQVEPGLELAEIKRLKDHGRPASPNYILQQFATPTDGFYNPYQWNFKTIQAEAAWDITDGTGVKVAVLDTGLGQGSDGIGCVLAGRDVVNNDNNPADGNGHGTHVSGTIAQRTNNGGTAGLAYGACIIPVKVLDDAGSGSDADIAEGIAWAINQGARVINMSLGYPAQYKASDFVGSASYNALNAVPDSVTVVVASGNEAATTGVSYPASHPNAISVGATGYSDLQSLPSIAPYSNQGSNLDLVAPGGDLSKDLNGDGYGDGILQETTGSQGWAHYFYQGTSMASPHVAAAAALLLAQDSTLDRHQILSKLTDTALDLGAPGKDNVFGHGLIQIHDALLAIAPVSNQAPNASFSYACTDLDCTFVSDSTDADGQITDASWAISGSATALNGDQVQYSFLQTGTYSVILTVTDDGGLTGTMTQNISVTAPVENQPPIASFTSVCTYLDCTLTSTSSDPDGSISQISWNLVMARLPLPALLIIVMRRRVLMLLH
jgi:serine protease